VKGYAYRPESDLWSQLPANGSPSARNDAHELVIGSAMLVWGGEEVSSYQPHYSDTGALYCYDGRVGTLNANLAFTGYFSPAEISISALATLVLKASNAGPDIATAVTVASDTTQDFAFSAVATPDADCTVPAIGTSGPIVCRLGTIVSGGSASARIQLSAYSQGGYALQGSAQGNEPDSIAANNSAAIPITVVDELIFYSGFEN
jgi:hypothetical protein